MKITIEMANELNEKLAEMDCSFRLKYDDFVPSLEVVPANMKFIESHILNLTEEFYAFLEEFFDEKGIKLRYNNTGSHIWSSN